MWRSVKGDRLSSGLSPFYFYKRLEGMNSEAVGMAGPGRRGLVGAASRSGGPMRRAANRTT